MTDHQTNPESGPDIPDPGPANVPRRRWLFGLLAVSIAINLFFAGLVAGRLVGGRDGLPPGPPPLVQGPGRVFEGLGIDYRGRALRHLEGKSGELRAHTKDLMAARRAVAEALVAEPFDREALDEAFAMLRAVSETTQAALHGVIADAAGDLPAEERGVLLRGFGGHRGGPDGRQKRNGGNDR
ncbi:MAG: periplasmic heavy metal sensor [Pseudomonadota bacterium]